MIDIRLLDHQTQFLIFSYSVLSSNAFFLLTLPDTLPFQYVIRLQQIALLFLHTTRPYWAAFFLRPITGLHWVAPPSSLQLGLIRHSPFPAYNQALLGNGTRPQLQKSTLLIQYQLLKYIIKRKYTTQRKIYILRRREIYII